MSNVSTTRSRSMRGSPPQAVRLWTGIPLAVGQAVLANTGANGDGDDAGDADATEVWQLGSVTLIADEWVRVCIGVAGTAGAWDIEYPVEFAADCINPIRSTEHQVVRTVGAVPASDLPPRVAGYRTAAAVARRAAARVAAETKALLRASLWHVLVLGGLAAQLASMGGHMDSRAYLIEMYSGPFRSMSHALQRGFARVATVTVDHNARFQPDVEADLRTWNMWGWLLQHGAFWTKEGRLWLPACLHFSPSCGTWARACYFHGRYLDVGGYCDDLASLAANSCAYAICFLLAQVRHDHLAVSYIVENPMDSLLWTLPCMVELMEHSTVLDVSYCLHGSGLEKRTRFVCSPGMLFPWAAPKPEYKAPRPKCRHYFRATCSGEGACGRMVAGAAPSTMLHEAVDLGLKHCGRQGGLTVADAEIPFLLACRLHEAWAANDSKSRARTPHFHQLELSQVTRLATDWAIEFNAASPDGPAIVRQCVCACSSCLPDTETAAAAGLLALSMAAQSTADGFEQSPTAGSLPALVPMDCELPASTTRGGNGCAVPVVSATFASAEEVARCSAALLERRSPSSAAPVHGSAMVLQDVTSSNSEGSDAETSDDSDGEGYTILAVPHRTQSTRTLRACQRCGMTGALLNPSVFGPRCDQCLPFTDSAGFGLPQ